MKINRLFSIAAAALMMVACSSEETALNNNPAAGSKMQFTATIAAPGSAATTRTEYSEVTEGEAAGTINVAWKVGDEIALIHNKVKDVATVKTINADGSATINGYVTGATNEADVQLYYPAVRISGVTSDGNPVFDGSVEGKISSQDGTLKYIQDNLDFRVGISTFSVNGSEATLKEAAKMYSQIAIWKLKLKDNASALLEASKVSIKMGSGDYTTSATATLSSPKSELTIATKIPRAIDNVRPITIEATVSNDTYVYSQDNVDVTPGKYYQSTVTMVKTIDLSELQADYEAKDGDVLTGMLGANVKVSIAAGATVTLAGITISGVHNNSYKWAGITCEGDATIVLKDGSTNSVRGFHHKYPGIFVPKDKTLTIKGETLGTGSLEATGSKDNDYGEFWGAGIGGGYEMASGNIVIQGGIITAYGDEYGAGIGSGGCEDYNASCGNITITGGTINATGGRGGAAIGSGGASYSHTPTSCGTITITDGVTKVTATKAGVAPNSIGAGKNGSCGTVTIGGKEGAISESPYTYPAPAIGDVGNPIGFDGGGDPLANN
jgi:hypothetical protein